MQPMKCVLTLWRIGLLSGEDVVRWADNELLVSPQPTQEIMDLSADGREKCLKRARIDFPARPAALSYSAEFAIRACTASLDSDEAAYTFADWAARHAMGQPLELPEVNFGYHLDHLLEDCGDRVAAIALVRKELPNILPQCQAIAAPFLEQLAVCRSHLNRTKIRSVSALAFPHAG